MHSFILAGGFATRLWPLTEKRAKPLLPLAGKPMLTHIVEQIPAGIPITVSTNAAFEQSFMEWKKTLSRDVTVRIEQTRSDDQKLGTLGATAQWITEENIDDDILLLTGDNYFGFSMPSFVERFAGNALVAAYDIKDKSKASAFGTIILGADGAATGFEEKPTEPKTSLVSTGCSILPKTVLPDLIAYAAIKPDNVGGIFEELLRLGKRVECFTFTEPWFDIGSFEAYLDATRMLVGEQILTADGSAIAACTCEGSVVLGKNSQAAASRLRDTVVFEGSIIENCIIENCIIDDNCVLKGVDLTGKMLRAGTTLVKG